MEDNSHTCQKIKLSICKADKNGTFVNCISNMLLLLLCLNRDKTGITYSTY
jgi:hypothetical protein